MRDLIDPEDGENGAVRAFLMHYGAPGLTVKQMRDNMRMAGWDGCWPAWVQEQELHHLTKGGAQHWLRHLFALEHTPADVPVVAHGLDPATVEACALVCERKSSGYWAQLFSGAIRELLTPAAGVKPPDDARDAARYRWLRQQHWNESRLCVVAQPRQAVRLGHDCPALDRLDAAIDDAMGANAASAAQELGWKTPELTEAEWRGVAARAPDIRGLDEQDVPNGVSGTDGQTVYGHTPTK